MTPGVRVCANGHRVVSPRLNWCPDCGDELPPAPAEAVAARIAADLERSPVPHPVVSQRRVTTLPTIPGYVVLRLHGLVTEVSSVSGWTAQSKGSTALERSLANLCQAAGEMGANAILGLQVSSFGAHGGVTNVVGGDAVGVVLIGTAVTVAPTEDTVRDGDDALGR